MTINLLKNLIGFTHTGQLCEMDLSSFDHFHFHYHWKDITGQYRDCNQRAVEDAGFQDRDSLIGLNDFDFTFLSDTQKNRIRKNDLKIMKQNRSELFIEPLFLYDGSPATAYSHKTPLRLRTKKVAGIATFSLIVKQEIPQPFNLQNDFSYSEEETKLTPQQFRCLSYVVKGMTDKQIARTLNLSYRTVEHYLIAVKRKLNCRTRHELIIKALSIPEILKTQ